MPIPFVVLVAGGGACVGLFVAALLLARSEGDRRAGGMLALLMALLSVSILYPLVVPTVPSLSRTHAQLILEPFQFLIAPLMALYFRVLLVPGFRVRPFQALHALPFILFGVATLVPIPAPGFRPSPASAARMTEALWALLVIQAFLYLVPSLRLLFRYRHALREQESNVAGLDLGWLQWFGHLFFLLNAAYAVLLVIMLHGSREFPTREYLSIALSVLVFAIGQRALMQRRAPLVDALGEPARQERTVVPPQEAERIKAELVRAMEVDELYLDPDLRLSDLVERLGVTRNQLSYVINKTLKKNFYDFVNEYRVRRVLDLLKEQSADDLKIISLAFDAGFNSKPAFNAVFKKYTGLTPSAYRGGRKKLSQASP